jgi:hypothetical protein
MSREATPLTSFVGCSTLAIDLQVSMIRNHRPIKPSLDGCQHAVGAYGTALLALLVYDRLNEVIDHLRLDDGERFSADQRKDMPLIEPQGALDVPCGPTAQTLLHIPTQHGLKGRHVTGPGGQLHRVATAFLFFEKIPAKAGSRTDVERSAAGGFQGASPAAHHSPGCIRR